MNSPRKVCYWCGEPATGKDHIPPKGFFPPQTRKNLITVPSCRKHNEDFKLLDERMRFYIQAVAENEMGELAFGGATLRGMLDPKGRRFLTKVLAEMRPALLNGKPITSGRVPAGDVETFSERIARGLHFRHYREQLRGKVKGTNTHMVLAGRDNRPAVLALEQLAVHLSPGDALDARVFAYWYGKTVEPGGRGFLIKMQFYQTVTFYVMVLDLNETPPM